MHFRLRITAWRWQYICLAAAIIAALGAGFEWRHGSQNSFNPYSTPKDTITPEIVRFTPNSFQSLAGFLTDANGPLEPQGRKQARIAEEARLKTRQLVKPDRSNIDCSYMKCIALTYDDGPEPELTSQLLKILQERQVVATFFVVGSRVHAQASTLKRAVAEGHEIGNHTWSHADLSRLPDQAIRDELSHASNAITEVTGVPPKLMRPPMGRYDQRVVEAAHMPLALWSIDPRDWRDRDPQTIYLRTISGAGVGKIILLHDTHATTIRASSWIIDELQRQGYVLVTMSELFNITESNVQEFSGQTLRDK